MRVAISSFMIFMFLLSLSCTEVNVWVEYDRGAKSPPTDLSLNDVPATLQASLPQLHPCQVDKAALCPPDIIGKFVNQAEQPQCTAPDPDKTPAIAQKTTSWCWAASAETVMASHEREITQCQGVNQVLDRVDCCVGENDQPPSECEENGWPYEVFNKNDFDWEWVDGPLNETTISGQLCGNGPFIFVLKLQGGGYHTLVVKSVEWTNGELFLWVHDHSWVGDDHPFGGGPPTEFQKWSYEEFKEGLWFNVDHENAFSFVAIRPL